MGGLPPTPSYPGRVEPGGFTPSPPAPTTDTYFYKYKIFICIKTPLGTHKHKALSFSCQNKVEIIKSSPLSFSCQNKVEIIKSSPWLSPLAPLWLKKTPIKKISASWFFVLPSSPK
jgi:hypothetical protein